MYVVYITGGGGDDAMYRRCYRDHWCCNRSNWWHVKKQQPIIPDVRHVICTREIWNPSVESEATNAPPPPIPYIEFLDFIIIIISYIVFFWNLFRIFKLTCSVISLTLSLPVSLFRTYIKLTTTIVWYLSRGKAHLSTEITITHNPVYLNAPAYISEVARGLEHKLAASRLCARSRYEKYKRRWTWFSRSFDERHNHIM